MAQHFSPRSLSRLVQWLFFLSSLWIGWRFFLFCQSVGTAGATLARPAGVEGFLPISALLGLRYALENGRWDPIHPAGLTVFLAALAMALLFRKAFCGHVCPVGFVVERLGRLGQRLGLARSVPRGLERLLRTPKYLLLAFFLVTVWFTMDGAGVAAFLHSSYNITADAKMLLFFLHPGLETVAVAGGLGLASLVWRGAPCRWLCPYGALLGLLALAGPLALARDSERCTGCGRCRRACPLDIPVASGRRPLECNGCAACVLACPTAAGAARLTLAGRTVPWWLPAAGALAVFVLAFAAARACGVWETTLPLSMLRRLYAMALAG